MRRRTLILISLILAAGLATLSCGKDKTKIQEVYLLYQDIYGVVEYEPDGDYPPPDNRDNFTDDYIMVELYFGQDIDIYKSGDVYGYCVTTYSNEENFTFPFVPSGRYWLNAEFTVMDSCFALKSETFTHTDTVGTFLEMRPAFLGLNKGCWTVNLAGVGGQEMVPVAERTWVTRSVYDRFYKDRLEGGELLKP